MGLNLWADLSSSGFPRSALLLTSIAVALFCTAITSGGEVMAIIAVARFVVDALLLFSF